jgi:hypothetical protein
MRTTRGQLNARSAKNKPRVQPGMSSISRRPQRSIRVAALHGIRVMGSPGKIQSMSYDSASQRLTVSFDSNRTVVFHDVPAAIRQSLQDTPEPDDAFSECVVGKFTWTQLRAKLERS